MTKFRPEVIAALGVAAVALVSAPLVLLPEKAPVATVHVATGASVTPRTGGVELQCPDVLHQLDPLSEAENPSLFADRATTQSRHLSSTDGGALRSLNRDSTFDALVNDLDQDRAAPALAAPKAKPPRGPKIRPQPREGSVTVSGGGQQGSPGQPLARPFVVTLKDAQGVARAGVPVEFYVQRGGGVLSADQVASDTNGEAASLLTLGPDEGTTVVGFRVERSRGTISAKAVANPAPTLSAFSGDAQSAIAGMQLKDPVVVQLLDAQGNPVPNVQVDFTLAAGAGQVNPSSVATDGQGYAQTQWILGAAAGDNALGASAKGVPGGVTFTAKGLPAAPVAAALEKSSGDMQQAPVGTKLAQAFRVTAKTAAGAPVGNVPVVFAVASGGGQLSLTATRTDAQGRAETVLTLGATAVANTVTASSPGLPTVTFSAVALPAPATTLVLVAGDGQSGVVGTKLVLPLEVGVVDANNQPVAGFDVSFSVATGAGQVSAAAVKTDANGYATTEWTLGPSAGTQTLTANAAGLSGSPLTFSAVALPPPAGTIVKVSGDNQTAVVGTALSQPLVVALTDANGQPAVNATVTFAVATGGGQLSASQVATDAQGRASVGLTLGPLAGAQTVTASAAGQTGSPLTFRAMAQAAAAGTLAVVAGDNQTAAVGTKLPLALEVGVVDANNQPVVGFDVTFAIASGGGQLSATAVKTDANGYASTELTLGPAAGTHTVTASAAGQSGSPVTFRAVAQAAAGTLSKVSGDQQSGQVGAKLPQPLIVRVTDAANQPVVGFDVAFAVTAGGGQLSASTTKTDAQGNASVELTLGTVPGANTVSVTAAGQAGSPLSFGAMAQAATPAALVSVSGDAQTGRTSVALTDPIVVQVNDAAGNPLPGVTVAFAVASGQGTVNPTTALSDAQGRASTQWTLGMNVQAQSLTASVSGVTPVTFNAMAIPLTYVADVKPILAAKCIVCHGPGGVLAAKPLTNYQEVVSGTSFANQPYVVAGDPGTSVLVQKTSPGGTMNQYLTPAEVAIISDWVLGGAVQTVQQVVPTTLEVTSGNNQTGNVGQPLNAPLVVTVKDMNGDPLAGVVVSWQVTAGGGMLADAMTLTDAAGQAMTDWSLGAVAGANTAQATAANLTPVTFTGTGSAGFSGAPLAGSSNPLDIAALSALQANGIEPAGLSSDEEFLSRVTADLVGRLPSEQEVRDFLASSDAQKRAAKIDRLLASTEFAEHWVRDVIAPWLHTRATFAEDINNVRTTFNFDAPMIDNVRNDMPVSQILSRLVQEQGDEGRAFWREHRDNRGHERTDVLMEAFTGMSSKCARCHDHPLTSPLDDPRWVQDDNFGLYAFTAGSNEDARKINKSGGRFGTPVEPRFVVDGYANAPANLPTLADPLDTRRQALAMLLSQSNAFYRGFSHRVWAEIAAPLLDPSQFLRANLNGVQAPVLLDALAAEFANSGTSLKGFLRLAMNSKLYQLSSERVDDRADRFQGRYVLRRNHSETLEQGVHQIADRTVSSNTLFRFTFGYPGRGTIDSRRDTVSLDQAFVLLNAPEAINGKIGNGSRIDQLANSVDGNQLTFEAAVTVLTRNGLGREPTAAELAACQQVLANSANTRECLQDVAAAIGASAEFVFR